MKLFSKFINKQKKVANKAKTTQSSSAVIIMYFIEDATHSDILPHCFISHSFKTVKHFLLTVTYELATQALIYSNESHQQPCVF